MLLHSLGQAVGADRHRNPPPDRRDVAQAPWTHMAQLCCMDAPQCPRLTARQGAALRGTEPLNTQGFAISQRGFLFPRGKGTVVHSEASFHGTEWGPTADFGRHRTLGLPIAPCCCQSPAAPAGPPFSLSRAFSPRSMSPGTPHPTRTDRPKRTRGQQPPLPKRPPPPPGAALGPRAPRLLGSRAAPGTAARPAPPSARPGAARRPPAEGPGERPGGPGGRAERRGGAGRGGAAGRVTHPAHCGQSRAAARAMAER